MQIVQGVWTTDRPEKSGWYLCLLADEINPQPLRYNQPNDFWVDLSGKTHKKVKFLKLNYETAAIVP